MSQQLIVPLTIIVVITATISSIISVRTQERQLLNAMITGADQLSKGITSATWHAMLADRREDAYRVMQTIALRQGIDRIRIFNKSGHIMFSTLPEEANTQVDKRAEACSVCHSSVEPRVEVDRNSRVRIFRRPDGRRNLAMVSPVYNEPACSQAACHAHPKEMKVLGVLDVALSLDAVDREISGVKLSAFLATGISILLIGVFIILFTHFFVAIPIQKLVDGTKAVSAMELDKPIHIAPSSEELEELARSFNAMRERLQAALAELNQFAQVLETKVEERTAQLKAAHQKLMQTDRMASLGQLAASVAHEINNPISGVLNLSMLMQRVIRDDGIPRDRIAEFRKYLAQIVGETTRAGRIVSDLLAFSRRSRPQRAQVDLNRIVRLTVSVVSHKLELANVQVELDLADCLPSLACDSSQIQQVVMNLLLNGAEAMQGRGQGRLWITTRPGEDGASVTLSVRDSGEGIPEENLSKIFEPFFTTKPEGKGVGLGLAVLYGIVEAHGGEVSVDSKVGQGTTFTVKLPLSPPAQPESPASEGAITTAVKG